MISYEMKPKDSGYPARTFRAPNAATALVLIDRDGCGETDVFADGAYQFTARLENAGFWSILQKDCLTSRQAG